MEARKMWLVLGVFVGDLTLGSRESKPWSG